MPETCRPIIRIDLDPTRRLRQQGDPGRVDNNRRGPKDTRPGELRQRAIGEPEAAVGRRRFGRQSRNCFSGWPSSRKWRHRVTTTAVWLNKSRRRSESLHNLATKAASTFVRPPRYANWCQCKGVNDAMLWALNQKLPSIRQFFVYSDKSKHYLVKLLYLDPCRYCVFFVILLSIGCLVCACCL